MDDWNTDPVVLEDLTVKRDIHGEWWQIPADELLSFSLGLTYLDAQGLEFYLPAYLTMALDDWGRHNVKLVLEVLDAGARGSDESQELAVYFEQRFTRIVGSKRDACIGFLEHAVRHLDPADELSGHVDAVRIRAQEFWTQDSAPLARP